MDPRILAALDQDIAERRNDKAFAARLKQMLVEHKPVLDALSA